MLSAAGFCHTHNESVSERPGPLSLGLNGERWRHGKKKKKERGNNTQEVFKGLQLLCF